MLDLIAHRRKKFPSFKYREKTGGKAFEEASFSFDLNCVEILLLPISLMVGGRNKSAIILTFLSRHHDAMNFISISKPAVNISSSRSAPKIHLILLRTLRDYPFFSKKCCNRKYCVSLSAFNQSAEIRFASTTWPLCWAVERDEKGVRSHNQKQLEKMRCKSI